MLAVYDFIDSCVNCRIGSLEISLYVISTERAVNCRIGSLESSNNSTAQNAYVNCRIGSLEKQKRQSLFMLQ